jgi:hypothetical protein
MFLPVDTVFIRYIPNNSMVNGVSDAIPIALTINIF